MAQQELMNTKQNGGLSGWGVLTRLAWGRAHRSSGGRGLAGVAGVT